MAVEISTNRYLTPAEHADPAVLAATRAEISALLNETELAEGEHLVGPVVYRHRPVRADLASCLGEICVTGSIEVVGRGDIVEPDGSPNLDTRFQRDRWKAVDADQP